MKHKSKLSPRQSETVFDDNIENAAAPTEIPDRIHTRKRRALVRRRKYMVMAVTGGFSCAALFLLVTILSMRAEYSDWKAQVARRQAEYDALQIKLKHEEKRLAALKSPQGRAELLIDNGYLKPGDRYLVFPAENDTKRLAAMPANDLAPVESFRRSPAAGGSLWRGAWDAIMRAGN
jgi:hypothetical protein